jgi:hypothetical protein
MVLGTGAGQISLKAETLTVWRMQYVFSAKNLQIKINTFYISTAYYQKLCFWFSVSINSALYNNINAEFISFELKFCF